jgi:hypothetical protein
MLEPIVRLMVVCEEVGPRIGAPHKIDILGVIALIDAPVEAFPLDLDFSVYVCFTNARGQGEGKIVIVHDQNNDMVYDGDPVPFTLENNPRALIATAIPVSQCTFPYPDLYRVNFVYNDVEVGKYLLHIREKA